MISQYYLIIKYLAHLKEHVTYLSFDFETETILIW